MRWIIVFALCSRLFATQVHDLIPSTPEEIASLRTDFLIGGYVNPLSGQLSLKAIDLHIHAAQDLKLFRTFVPVPIMGRYGDKNHHDRFGIATHDFNGNSYKGWVISPHLYCGYNTRVSKYFQLPDPSGFILSFQFNGNMGALVTPTFGMSNLDGEEVSSHVDLRNIQLIDEGRVIRVITPNGIERVYRKLSWYNHQLEKEIFPNGKAIFYEYDPYGCLSKIISGDAERKYEYATIERKGLKYFGSDGTEATYAYEKRVVKGERKKEKITVTFNLLSQATNPFYSNTVHYNQRTLLTGYDAQAFPITCEYTTQKNVPVQVSSLSFPDGNQYSFSYERPNPGKHGGKTTVTKPNGTQVIYRFNDRLLLTSIENWNGKLINQKNFYYDAKQHVSRIETKDGEGNILLARVYECDEFGNPLVETLQRDFGSFTTKRSFSRSRLLREEREDGLGFQFTYLGDTHLITSKTTLDHGVPLRKTVFHYDDACNLVEMREEGRTITTYARRSEHPHLHRVEWEEERDWDQNLLYKRRYSYDQWGNITQEEVYGSDDNLAYTLEKIYNEKGELLQESNPLEQIAKYEYDLRRRLVKKTPFAQRPLISREYDEKGRLVVFREDEHITTFSYDSLDCLVQKKDYLGFVTRYVYDPVHLKPIEIHSPPQTLNKTYDPFGREIIAIDGEGYQTLTRYNAYGSPVEIKLPGGGIRTFEYDTNGNLLRKKDGDGITTTYAYDVLKRVTSSKEANARTAFEYDAYELVKEVNSEGITTSYSYDGAGRKVKEDTSGRVTVFSYNPLGFLERESRKDQWITYNRDVLGRILQESKSDQLITSWTYDEAGNTASKTQGGTFSYTYDNYDRLVEKIDPMGAITTIDYEEEDQLLTKWTTDSRGVSTIETYDPHGLLLQREVSDIQVQEFEYDRNFRKVRQDHLTFSYTPDGYLRSQTEAGIRSTYWTYTPEGRIKTKQYPNGKILSYSYDRQGYLSKINDLEYRYDTLGRLISGSGFQRKLDPFGNLLKESLSNGLSVVSEYDDWDRPLKRVLSDQSSFEYIYDHRLLRKVTRKDANGKVLYSHSYDNYDEAGRLIQETHRSPVEYAYDFSGRQTLRQDQYLTESCKYDLEGNLLQKGNIHYTYDDLSQITSESDQFEGAYDGRYNRVEWNGEKIAINDLNQLNSEKYDLNGNLLRPGYVYDEYNRLIQAGSAHYTYDAIDRRLTKDGISYIYLGNQEIGAADSKELIHLQVLGLGRAVGIEIHQKHYIPIYDVQGTIRKLVNWKNGEICEQNESDIFGQGLSSYIPYAYAGKSFDPESGLIYFGKRFYDPNLGRWMTPDPIGPVNHSNLYQYDFNNPVRYIDQDGQFAWLIAIPLLFLGAEVTIPTMAAIAAPIFYSAVAGAVAYGGYKVVEALNSEQTSHYIHPDDYNAVNRKKAGSIDPTLSDDPLNDPNLEDVSRPEAKKKGHYTFKDKRTGELVKYDEGRPGKTGHEGHDHYHRPNPQSNGDYDYYLDGKGQPIKKGSEASHLYPPAWVWWD